jgi:MFS family permease
MAKASSNLFLILCIVGLFAILSSTMSKNPVLKPFATSLGAPDDFVGLVAAASTIPGMLVSLPAASLSDVFGRRKILLFSGFVFASAPFLYLFINSWWQLIPVRFYHGFATAIFVPVAEAAVAERFPLKRGERISIFSSFSAVGRAIAPFLGGYILFLTNYGYSTLYLSVGIAGVTAFIIMFFFLIKERPEKLNNSRETATGKVYHGWLEVAKNREVQIVAFVQACQYYVFGTVEFFLVGYLAEVVKLDPFSIGIIMGSQIIALILARPIAGRI